MVGIIDGKRTLQFAVYLKGVLLNHSHTLYLPVLGVFVTRIGYGLA